MPHVPPAVIQGCFPHGVRLPGDLRNASPQQVRQAIALPAAWRFGHLSGQPLPKNVLQRMEDFFQTPFTDIRVHLDPSAGTLGAQAFAHGAGLHFAAGHYDPHTSQGQRLIARQLAHVVQQRTGRVVNPFHSGIAIVRDPHLDREAEATAVRVMQRRVIVTPRVASPIRLGHLAHSRRGHAVYAAPIGQSWDHIASTCLDNSNRPALILGHTSFPQGYTAPDYAVSLDEQLRLVCVKKQDAQEGTVLSEYVQAGRYPYKKLSKGQQVYLVVSEEAAEAAKTGEMEHVADHQLAYDRTLGAADRVMNELAARSPIALDADREHANDAAAAYLKAAFASVGLTRSRNAWIKAFEAYCAKTALRDSTGSHTMTTGPLIDCADGFEEHVIPGGKTFKLGASSAEILDAKTS